MNISAPSVIGSRSGSLLTSARRVVSTVMPIGRRLWLLLLLAVVWEVLARRAASPFIPPMSTILGQFCLDWLPVFETGRQNLVAHALPTLATMLGGWVLAAITGVPAGLLLGRQRTFAAFVRPMLVFAMNVPPPALLPLAILLFGFSTNGMLFLICFGAVWPVLVNTLDAACHVDPRFIASSRVLHFGRWQFVTRVLVPACSPRIMAGLRVGLSLSLILTVIVEMYGATSGIGRAIVSAQRSFQTLEMWSGIVMLAVLGVSTNGLLVLIERRVLRWQAGDRAM